MKAYLHRIATGVLILVSAATCAGAQGWRHLGKVQSITKLKDGVELASGTARVRVTVFREGIFRVHVAPNGVFPKDSSWAIIETAEPPAVKIEESPNSIKLSSGTASAIIQRSTLLIDFADSSGNVIVADDPNLPMAWNGTEVRVWKKMPIDENYYGLGDKTGPMNRRNRSFSNWNTDAFGFQESTDPIYKTIPFFIGLRKGTAYGLFFDNTYWSSFDFGKESRDYYSFGAEGGEINYYFFAGPEPKKILEAYTALTGRPPLPPYWTLGYQQCRYSYYPEARVREIAKLLREKKIPADTIYLDIDYQQGYAPFTINREYFPNFEKLITDLRDQGFHVILITDMHIKNDPGKGYAPYDSGMKEDVFVKNPDGTPYVGPVWPGASVFPDFTLTRAREWWGRQYQDFVGKGVAGFWNDMNEPAVFSPSKTMPLDVVHRLDDGTLVSHRAAHNIMGMENARATYEGLLKLKPDERPFVLTRAAYSGTQRYSATWTGDNLATWNHIGMSTSMLLSLGISGYAMVGDDIGGFGSSPPSNLLTRWYELGAFNPIYRDHAAKETLDHEPWVNGPEQEVIRRKYIELRYRILPYIYTHIEETARTGIPLMRPLILEYPKSEEFYGENRDFLFGPDLFVSPVVSETMDAHNVKLPPGEWYDFWTSGKYSNKSEIKLHPRMDEVPLYVRAGAILPLQPVIQNTSETPKGPLQLRVYPPANSTETMCGGELYQDDGHTFAYQKGAVLRVKYSCQVSAESITISSLIDANAFHPWWSSAELTIYGAALPKEIRVGDAVVHQWHYDGQNQTVTLTVPDAVKSWTVKLTF